MSVTKELAAYLVAAQPSQIPAEVKREARRSLFNYLGCALGGCRNEAVEIALRVLGPYSGPATARVLGRAERLDPMTASLINGISSHVLDFDDTVAKNFIHPSSPVASALFAYAAAHRVSGPALAHAFTLGVEAQSRVGNAVYPWHYDAGWHITGTAGVIGAGVGIGLLLGLSAQQMVWTIGLSATQAAGLREMFGSMGKAFHPGRSAQSGYLAALLAQGGFTAGEYGIEGPRGFAHVTASQCELGRVTEHLGTHFELLDNTYKPFPCGIVIHPAIDACIQLHREHRLTAPRIAAVALRVAPIVLDLCNKKQISTGLEGKFSVYHAAAIGLVRGKAGVGEFTDEVVNDPTVRQVRERISASADPSLAEDAVVAEVTLADGSRIVKHVLHAIGNVERPMSDRELEEKFRDQAGEVIPAARMDEVVATCWKLEELADCRPLVEMLTARA